MDDDSFSKGPEPKIEDVLKEIKKEFVGQSPDDVSAASDKPEASAIQNLKKVLEEADAQAGSLKDRSQSTVEPKEASVDFNENFFKLEQLIKEMKKER
jgi:hypothetical protein